MVNAIANQKKQKERLLRLEPVSAPEEREAAEAVSVALRVFERPSKASRKSDGPCLVGPDNSRVPIPAAMFYALQRIAELLARGDAFAVVPVGKELTTQEAANILNVSRQYVVRLLEEKQIPFQKTGSHRRIKFSDLVAYKEKRDHARRATLQKLTEESEEDDYYGSRSE